MSPLRGGGLEDCGYVWILNNPPVKAETAG